MPALSEVVRSVAPLAVLSIPANAWTTNPDAWASSPGGRPRFQVTVGLRRLSDADMQSARAQAAEKAHKDYACRACKEITSAVDQIDAFNDALMHIAIGRAATQPTDVSVPYFEREEDDVRARMTPEGARFVWDAIERLHIGDSPVVHAATDDEILSLSLAFAAPDALRGLSVARALRIRKLATFIADELRDTTSEL